MTRVRARSPRSTRLPSGSCSSTAGSFLASSGRSVTFPPLRFLASLSAAQGRTCTFKSVPMPGAHEKRERSVVCRTTVCLSSSAAAIGARCIPHAQACRDQRRQYNPAGESPDMARAETVKLRKRFAGESRGRCFLTNPAKGREATLRAVGNERRASLVRHDTGCRATHAFWRRQHRRRKVRLTPPSNPAG